MKHIGVKLILIHVVFFACIACTLEDDYAANCDTIVETLENSRLFIEDLAANSICNEEFECRSIAFGTKPCGGPWTYLVYSTSIDTLELVSRVNDYNELEMTYNINCGAVSDCSLVNPPIELVCENNQCIAVY